MSTPMSTPMYTYMLEKYKFLASVLSKINRCYPNDDDYAMISIRQSEPNKFFRPLLYQIIKNHDGRTFTFQHLEKGTHKIIKKVTLTNIELAFENYVDVNTVNGIDLTWGPCILFDYKIKQEEIVSVYHSKYPNFKMIKF